MKSNKGRGTKPELLLAKYLRKRPARSTLPGRPDFVYTKAKLAVFVHGCFWHRCPVHGISVPKTHAAFWNRKFERNVERDRLNREDLVALGWTVVEVWEHDVLESPRVVGDRISALARARRSSVA